MGPRRRRRKSNQATRGRRPCVWLLGLLVASPLSAQPLGTAFTYQGRLTDAGSPANGNYDLQLALFDAASGGAQVGSTLTRDDMVVTNGLFTVSLDFGAVFAGSKRWLALGVRPGASTGAYTTLAERQELTPAPNAAFSLATPWTGVSGKPAGFADDIDNDSGGDITAVTAGTGLTGGGTSGALTVGANLAGSGSANTIARSDHNHAGQVWSASQPSQAVFAAVNAGSGGFSDGLWGQADAAGNGRGVVGYATATTGQNYGVWGQSDSTAGRGVFGLAAAAGGVGVGVYGQSDSTAGRGVFGLASAAGSGGVGVYGQTNAPFGYGVRGVSSGVAIGVLGVTDNNVGVWGAANGSTGTANGILGTSFSTSGTGVRGRAQNAAGSGTTFAIYGEQPASPNGYGGYFEGRVHVTGTLSKGAGSFKIDHPLDPENRYLYHSFVESPDMMNVYNGNVTTDGEGFATVELPDWFEALNKDFRYQLTVIGQFAQAIVARKVEGNRFSIRTDRPAVEVSWQVTGIRQDPFAERNRIPVEEDKPEGERGTYLHPRAWGQPEEAGLDHKRRPPMPEAMQ